MAGGYIIDPATGQAGVPMASGGFLPLPMSPDQLTAAGLPGPPGLPPAPDMGPDMRVAGPGGGRANPTPAPQILPSSTGGRHNPSAGEQAAMQAQNAQRDAEKQAADRAHLEEVARGGGRAGASAALALQKSAAAAPPPAAVPAHANPDELARPGATGGQAPAQQQQGGTLDPLEQLAYEQALQRGGGGGPRQLGVTGQTEKYTTFEKPGGDPAKVAAAKEAIDTYDKYGEETAKSLTIRQEQAYQAQQQEYAARSGQMAAQQQRYEQQQNALQDYQAKRESFVQQAAQLKTPQMEDYWGSRGTFANVMTGLSIALGGALQGLRGGQNPGLEMSNQSIDRWINAQQEDYKRAQGRVTDADNQFARAVQMFGSENLAASHLREQAWGVRDGMLKSYAEKIGTPSALEAYNEAMLQSEAKRAALVAQNSMGAEVEIEKKLSMQGGGGAARPKVKDAVHDAALVHEDLAKLRGQGKDPERPVSGETTEALTGALDTITAARNIRKTLQTLGDTKDDTDDPRSGPVDYVAKNIPGTETRKRGQDLDIDTEAMARGMQKSDGKSDKDADLAGKRALGQGGSYREREQAALRAEAGAVRKIKLHISSMTPDQRRVYVQSLPADVRQTIVDSNQSDTRGASSEKPF